VTNKIEVAYTQGSGGEWLSHLLEYCITPDSEWNLHKINFHRNSNLEPMVPTFHYPCHIETNDVRDSVLSIGNGDYKFNFWTLYVHKRILYEVQYQRINGSKLIVCPYAKYGNPEEDFFWLLDQCRFIQGYYCPGKFQIDWKDLFYSPDRVWQIVCDFLEHNQMKNYITFSKFSKSLDNYKNTCLNFNFNINFNQKFFRIWQLAFLQNTKEHPAPFQVFEKFNTLEMQHWLSSKRELVREFTNNNRIDLGKSI
jgi:hypothetical protein